MENTSHGLNRDLQLMFKVSEATGVNVVAGTGHYVHGVQPESVISMTIEEMADLYTKEILFGVPVRGVGSGTETINCGVIGEVGSSWPITAFERKAIQATAETQSVLNCPVTFHPGRERDAPFEIIRVYLEAGGKADKCVMSHLGTIANWNLRYILYKVSSLQIGLFLIVAICWSLLSWELIVNLIYSALSVPTIS